MLFCSVVGIASAQPAGNIAYTSLKEAPDQFLTFKDVKLRYRDLGKGEPVVLLHGYSLHLLWWDRLVDFLALTHRVIALDLRGFGASSKFADPAQYDTEMMEDLAQLIKALHLRRVHLIGHSMGALLAANFALTYPKQTASLTLAAGPLYADERAMKNSFWPHLEKLQKGEGLSSLYSWLLPMLDSTTLAMANKRILAQNDLGSLQAVLETFPKLVISPAQAKKGQIPALVIVGSTDPFLEPSGQFARWWPKARMVEVSGAYHSDVVFHPQFLAEVRSHISAP